MGPKIVWVLKHQQKASALEQICTHDRAIMMHAAPVCVAPALCRPRDLCLSVMHVPAAACIQNSWQPGGVRGSPSMRHKVNAHALRGRRSTRTEGGDQRAPWEVIHALQESRSKCFKGCDPRAPREAIHALRWRRSTRSEESDPRTAREVIHAL